MKRLGISISRERLAAFAWEETSFRRRALAACSVACTEPFGNLEDIRALAEKLKTELGAAVLPQAVLSLPPAECHVRIIELPVADLKKARSIHGDEIEGSLPFDGEEISSDILPASGPVTQGARFVAFAARRSTIDRFTTMFSEASIPVERVVTDHVSLLCAAASLQSEGTFSLISFETDIVRLSVANGVIERIRQYPAHFLGADPSSLPEFPPPAEPHGPLLVAGHPPSQLEALLTGDLAQLVPPGDFPDPSAIAFGASQLPFSGKVSHDFALFRPGGNVDDEGIRRKRARIAVIAAVLAILASVFALELARWASAKQVAAVRKQLRAEFQAAVPEAKVVVRETAQIREKISSLQKQRNELGLDLPRLTPLLSTLSAALPSNQSISVKEISIDGGRVRIAGESSGGQNVESYRASLAAALGPAYDVTVQESRGSARGDTITFSILVEKGKGSRAS